MKNFGITETDAACIVVGGRGGKGMGVGDILRLVTLFGASPEQVRTLKEGLVVPAREAVKTILTSDET